MASTLSYGRKMSRPSRARPRLLSPLGWALVIAIVGDVAATAVFATADRRV
jgi:hypothetical protein